MNEIITTVPLFQAYQWDCPHCATVNWCRAVTQQLSREEQKNVLISLGDLEEWQEPNERMGMSLIGQPDVVVCSHCGKEWAACDPMGECECGPLDDDEPDEDCPDDDGDDL